LECAGLNAYVLELIHLDGNVTKHFSINQIFTILALMNLEDHIRNKRFLNSGLSMKKFLIWEKAGFPELNKWKGVNKKRKPKKKRVKPPKYHSYIKSPAWKSKRENALKHHGRCCKVCGTSQNIGVHHLTYKNLGNEKMEDLTVLCWEHHSEHHSDLDAKESSFTKTFLK
jgi:hypothetical protein